MKHSPLVRKVSFTLRVYVVYVVQILKYEQGVNAACPVNSKDFPSSIVFAINNEQDGKVDMTSLLIGRVRELQKLHIRTVSCFILPCISNSSLLVLIQIPFGLDNPVRIAHLPQLKVLGVGCQRTQPYRVAEYALESCSFKIIDDTTFERETLSTRRLRWY